MYLQYSHWGQNNLLEKEKGIVRQNLLLLQFRLLNISGLLISINLLVKG